MAFTKIPDSNLAGALGSVLGKAAGTVTSKAEDSLKSLQTKLLTACKQVIADQTNGKVSSSGYAEIEKIEATLNSIETSLNNLEKSVNTLNGTITGVSTAVVGLQVALAVIKALPIPQRYQVVAFSMIEADLMILLSETVTQINQIVETLKKVITTILNLIKKILDFLAKIRKILDMLRISKALSDSNISDENKENLRNRRILDENNQDIFVKLGETLGENELASRTGINNILWFGDLGGIDRYSTVVQNKVYATDSGKYVDVSLSNSGDWLNFAFFGKSTVMPPKPTTRELLPKNWTLTEPSTDLNLWWYSRATVSGLTGKVDTWTKPELYTSKTFKYTGTVGLSKNYTGKIKSVLVYRLGENQIDPSKFDLLKTYAVILVDVDTAYTFMLDMLNSLDGIEDLKSNLGNLLNTSPTVSTEETNTDSKYFFTTPNGDVLQLRIVVDPKSPKISKRRYVEVLDLENVVVYTGTKSFTTSNDILLEETKVRLGQLFV